MTAAATAITTVPPRPRAIAAAPQPASAASPSTTTIAKRAGTRRPSNPGHEVVEQRVDVPVLDQPAVRVDLGTERHRERERRDERERADRRRRPSRYVTLRERGDTASDASPSAATIKRPRSRLVKRTSIAADGETQRPTREDRQGHARRDDEQRGQHSRRPRRRQAARDSSRACRH